MMFSLVKTMASCWIVATVIIPFLAVAVCDPCVSPGEFLNGSSGLFNSPNFPGNFTANSNCTWNITVSTGKIIKVTFFNFSLEPDQDASCVLESQGARVFISNVALNDGKQDFQICGQKLSAPVYSVGNSILVRLRSISNVYSGFNASYEAIDEGQLCPKDVTLTETSGVISSPFFPRNYPDNLNCSWQITAPQGKRVKLVTIEKVNIQTCGGSQCTCDYLQVQNGFTDDYGEEKVCGFPYKVLTYYSTHESLKVLFVSDDTGSKTFDGFEATYTQINYTPPVCPTQAIPLSGNGSLSSPNYPMSNYPAARNCSWIITVPSDKQVKFVFTELALGSCEQAAACNSSNCTYVELYDGASTGSASLGRFCNGSVLQDVYSSGYHMFVQFHSGSSLDRGFEAQYFVSSGKPTMTPSQTVTTPSSTVKTSTETASSSASVTPTSTVTASASASVTPISTVTASTTAPIEVSYKVDSNKIESDQALLTLANKEFLSNGNRARYVQVIVIQREDKDQDIGTSTDEKYANIDKDYESKEEGEAYITAEFDYGKTEFTIGDEKYYSRSKEGSKRYLNGKLESNSDYAAFQRSFDDFGSYDSEKLISFKTKKSFPWVTVVVVVVVVVIIAAVLIAFAIYKVHRKTPVSKDTEMKESKEGRGAYQNPEYILTAEEKQASVGAVVYNPSYDKNVNFSENAADPRQEGDYEEIKEVSTAKEGNYQELNMNQTTDYEGLNPSQGFTTSF